MKNHLALRFILTICILCYAVPSFACRWLIRLPNGAMRGWDWPEHRRVLRVHVQTSDSGLAEDARDAMEGWNEACSTHGIPWRFVPCTPPPPADVVIRPGYVPGPTNHGMTDIDTVRAPGGGLMIRPPAVVTIDTTSNWDFFHRVRVIMHELGHCMGMGDFPRDTNALLNHAHAADPEKPEIPNANDVEEARLTAAVNSYCVAMPSNYYEMVMVPDTIAVFPCETLGPPCSYLMEATEINVTHSWRTFATVLTYSPLAAHIHIAGSELAEYQEEFILNITTADRTVYSIPFYILFGTTPPPPQSPVAVLPPDTAIYDTSTIIIDGSASYHQNPALDDYMAYTFIIDERYMISSGDMLLWRFSAGNHLVRLLVTDTYGKFSNDSMRITVAMSTSKKELFPLFMTSVFFMGQSGPDIYAISVSLPEQGEIDLSIYNILGTRIADIFNGFARSGDTFYWNGKDASGNRVPAGVYLAVLRSKQSNASCKIIVLE